MQILFVHTLRPYLNILIHLIHRSHSAMEAMLISRPLNTCNTEKEMLLYNTTRKWSTELKQQQTESYNRVGSSNNNRQIVRVQQRRELKQQQ